MSADRLIQEEFLQRLASFRPSDRNRFKRAFASEKETASAEHAIQRFVEGWENGSWVETYALERIGKWLAVNAPSEPLQRIDSWARHRQTKARKALRTGIREGKRLEERDRSLLMTQ